MNTKVFEILGMLSEHIEVIGRAIECDGLLVISRDEAVVTVRDEHSAFVFGDAEYVRDGQGGAAMRILFSVS